jgi:hypothetical protein
MRCPLCDERKGKRPCPAKGQPICTQCCGEKRILEINCPESCAYLKEGRAREARHGYARHLRPSDPAKAQRYRQVLTKLEDVLSSLEYAIADARRSNRALADSEVAEAVALMLKTLQTEDRGILYEHTSNSLQVEALRRQLRDVIQQLRYPKQAGREPLRLRDAMGCLELIGDVVASYMAERHSAVSYAGFLARMMPPRSRVGNGGPSLIIPGR